MGDYRGLYRVPTIGIMKGDARSLDYSSYRISSRGKGEATV